MAMTVKDVMTREPMTLDPEAPVVVAMETMRANGIRHLPVTDERGQLVGIVTDSDLRSAAFAPLLAEHLSAAWRRRLRGVSQRLEDLRVKDVMTWEVVTIEPAAPLGRAAAVMLEQRFSCLPVKEGSKLVGIVTERDLLKALAALLPPVKGMDPAFLW